jgi:hypothetical protein
LIDVVNEREDQVADKANEVPTSDENKVNKAEGASEIFGCYLIIEKRQKQLNMQLTQFFSLYLFCLLIRPDIYFKFIIFIFNSEMRKRIIDFDSSVILVLCITLTINK